MTVHILRSGLAECGAGSPRSWPEADRWVPYDSPEDVLTLATCPGCRGKAALAARVAAVSMGFAHDAPSGESTAHTHWLWRRPWYSLATAVAATGHDCTVLDPDAEADEDLYDGNPDHGTIHLRTVAALGWTLQVFQVDGDLLEDEE